MDHAFPTCAGAEFQGAALLTCPELIPQVHWDACGFLPADACVIPRVSLFFFFSWKKALFFNFGAEMGHRSEVAINDMKVISLSSEGWLNGIQLPSLEKDLWYAWLVAGLFCLLPSVGASTHVPARKMSMPSFSLRKECHGYFQSFVGPRGGAASSA